MEEDFPYHPYEDDGQAYFFSFESEYHDSKIFKDDYRDDDGSPQTPGYGDFYPDDDDAYGDHPNKEDDCRQLYDEDNPYYG